MKKYDDDLNITRHYRLSARDGTWQVNRVW